MDYITHDELTLKLAMCRFLRLKPLFIMRAAPKTYIEEIVEQGGFSLIFDWQLYPHGYLTFAKRIHKRLGIPVDSPRAIAQGTIQRFLDWHLKHLNPSNQN